MLLPENNNIPYMKSLATCLNRIVTDGYTEDFEVTEKGLKSLQKENNYNPEQVKVINSFKFEGLSDPDDNATLYVIETTDGTKGTLIDADRVNNQNPVTRFISDVDTFKKKVVKN